MSDEEVAVEKTVVEEYTSTPEGMAAFQQERVILEATMIIQKLLKEKALSKADLALRLGKSKAYITQLLNGQTNMTLRTISDVFSALGRSLRLVDRPISISTNPLLVSEVKLGGAAVKFRLNPSPDNKIVYEFIRPDPIGPSGSPEGVKVA